MHSNLSQCGSSPGFQTALYAWLLAQPHSALINDCWSCVLWTRLVSLIESLWIYVIGMQHIPEGYPQVPEGYWKVPYEVSWPGRNIFNRESWPGRTSFSERNMWYNLDVQA